MGFDAGSTDAEAFARVIAPLDRELGFRFRVACCEAWSAAPMAALVVVMVAAAFASFWAVAGDTVMSMPSMRPR